MKVGQVWQCRDPRTIGLVTGRAFTNGLEYFTVALGSPDEIDALRASHADGFYCTAVWQAGTDNQCYLLNHATPEDGLNLVQFIRNQQQPVTTIDTLPEIKVGQVWMCRNQQLRCRVTGIDRVRLRFSGVYYNARSNSTHGQYTWCLTPVTEGTREVYCLADYGVRDGGTLFQLLYSPEPALAAV